MEEREINLADLMAEILLHWRMFIVWMLGGGGSARRVQLCAF